MFRNNRPNPASVALPYIDTHCSDTTGTRARSALRSLLNSGAVIAGGVPVKVVIGMQPQRGAAQ